jgi:dTDP-4-amino-4,6-dideoxygalactose transaminase
VVVKSEGAAQHRPSSPRLYLSPPCCGDEEVQSVQEAIRSGWVAPLGPEVDALEAELAQVACRDHAVALSSGTAALHLGLLALGIRPGDEVVIPTMTFGATAFAVTYAGASPVLLDVEEGSWNLDPDVLAGFLAARAKEGRRPAAVIPVDVFGRTCDYDAILPICQEYGVPVLCDSAEALGASHGARPAGALGAAAVFSFNGNKIITTSGGGALVTDDPEIARKVRKWATQSREPYPWYEHEEIGFNYRLSNVLAALGRSQLARLPEIMEKRRSIRDRYATALEALPGVTVMGDPPWGKWNGWLTTVRFDSSLHPDAPRRVREALEMVDVESRPVWKPMHQQPVFRAAESTITGVADRIFLEGLCLPSGTAMTDADVDRVIDVVLATIGHS